MDCCPPPPSLHMEGFHHMSASVWFCYSSELSAWQMFACKFLNRSAPASLCSCCIHQAFYPIVYGEQCCLPAPASFLLQGNKPVQQLWDTMLGTRTGRKKTIPSNSSMFIVSCYAAEWRCKCRKVLHEVNIWWPRAETKGLGALVLIGRPSASTDWAHLICWLAQKCH